MLQEIKKLFEIHRLISLYDLKVHFDIDEEAMKDMLQIWIKKGKLIGSSHCNQLPCEGCAADDCDPSKYQYYEEKFRFQAS